MDPYLETPNSGRALNVMQLNQAIVTAHGFRWSIDGSSTASSEANMAGRTVSSAISAHVIDLVTKRGMTLTAIARAIGVTKSFLGRVKARSRSLTIDHLVALEAVIGEPLPLLLLRATPIEAVPKDLRPLYRSTARVARGGVPKTKRQAGRSSKAA
jgi:hypothetical protein